MGDDKPQGNKKVRGKYKPPMGCFAKMVLTVVIIGALLVIAMAIHYWCLKRSNPELTLDNYLTATYESTKTTITRYKNKVVEWKEWLAPTHKTQRGAGELTSVPRQESEEALHPEFQAATDEFRAGLEHFQKSESNEAYDSFIKAQEHLEKYKRVNPNDPRIKEFEKELTPYIHAAMKDSKVP